MDIWLTIRGMAGLLRSLTYGSGLVLAILGVAFAGGQAASAHPPDSAGQVTATSDTELDAAEALIGRALFLRGFYAGNDLSYDVSGRLQGVVKTDDWTLAAVDVKKAERHGPKSIYLEGLRVAIRYNADNHQFERHPLKDETVRILIADPGSARGLEAAFAAIFAQGIDPRLQQSVPGYWQHYFNPALGYPQDALTGQQILGVGGATAATAAPVTAPTVAHKVEARTDDFAERDHIQGTVQMRMVIDAAGVPQRISIARPLGYGLDARAVESVSKWRFTPAKQGDRSVPVNLVVNYDFILQGTAHP